MPDRTLATRNGLNMGLVIMLPLVVWLLGEVFLARASYVDIAITFRKTLVILLLLQSCSLAVCLPWLLRFPKILDRWSGITMLLLVPTPLYGVVWLAGGAEAGALALAMFVLGGLALLLYGFYAICLGWASPGQPRAIIVLSSQLLLTGLCWHYRDLWQHLVAL